MFRPKGNTIKKRKKKRIDLENSGKLKEREKQQEESEKERKLLLSSLCCFCKNEARYVFFPCRHLWCQKCYEDHKPGQDNKCLGCNIENPDYILEGVEDLTEEGLIEIESDETVPKTFNSINSNEKRIAAGPSTSASRLNNDEKKINSVINTSLTRSPKLGNNAMSQAANYFTKSNKTAQTKANNVVKTTHQSQIAAKSNKIDKTVIKSSQPRTIAAKLDNNPAKNANALVKSSSKSSSSVLKTAPHTSQILVKSNNQHDNQAITKKASNISQTFDDDMSLDTATRVSETPTLKRRINQVTESSPKQYVLNSKELNNIMQGSPPKINKP